MFAARKRYENRVSEQAAVVNRGVLWVRITSPIILSVREGDITQSRAKSPGAPQTSTLSLCLIEKN